MNINEWEWTEEDFILAECDECGEPCHHNDDICTLCYLKLAPVQGEA